MVVRLASPHLCCWLWQVLKLRWIEQRWSATSRLNVASGNVTLLQPYLDSQMGLPSWQQLVLGLGIWAIWAIDPVNPFFIRQRVEHVFGSGVQPGVVCVRASMVNAGSLH